MNKNHKSISEKDNPQNEDCCVCDCKDQVDETIPGNALGNEKINKKNSCC